MILFFFLPDFGGHATLGFCVHLVYPTGILFFGT
jgi:hypothetical protein